MGRTGGRTGGRGNGRTGRGGRGNRGSSSTSRSTDKKTGVVSALSGRYYTFGTNKDADNMKKATEKLIEYVGHKWSEDMANELRSRTQVEIPVPTVSETVRERALARLSRISRKPELRQSWSSSL